MWPQVIYFAKSNNSCLKRPYCCNISDYHCLFKEVLQNINVAISIFILTQWFINFLLNYFSFITYLFIIQMNILEGVDKVSYMMTLLRCLLFWFWGTDTLVNPLIFTSTLWNEVSCTDKCIVFYIQFSRVMYLKFNFSPFTILHALNTSSVWLLLTVCIYVVCVYTVSYKFAWS